MVIVTPLCEEKKNPLNCTLSMGKFYMFIICQLSYWLKKKKKKQQQQTKRIQKGWEIWSRVRKKKENMEQVPKVLIA